MNKYLSEKIKVVSFICIVMVVFVHAYNFKDSYLLATTIVSEGLNYATFFEYFISNGFTRGSVPIFFMISGYLFYLSFKLTAKSYSYKVKSRFLTLFIPYMLWTALAIGVCYAFSFIDIWTTSDLVDSIKNYGILPKIISPPCFQFWFVLQLMIYVILSPIIFVILRYKASRIVYFIFMFVCWFINFSNFGMIITEAIFFYSIGAALAICKKENWITKLENKKSIILWLIVWIVTLSIKTVMLCTAKQGADITIPLILYKANVLMSIYVMWYGFDCILYNEKIKEKLLNLSKYTFFIFCIHEPIMNILMQYTQKFIVYTTFTNFVFYIIYPVITILFALAVGKLLNKYLSGVYNVLCGSRGSKKFENKISSSFSN